MKKLLSVLLAVAMLSVLAVGCGGSSNSAKADAWYIGGSGPLTGAAAMYGTGVKNGAQLAIDEINEAGGINGYTIEYNFQDDEHDAEKAVNAYNTLKDWGMNIMMGTVTTTPCLAVIDQTYADGIFQLTPSASSADVIKNDNVFQVCFTDPNQGTVSADYIADNNVASKVAVIYDSSDAYSTGICENFVAEAEEKGLKVVSQSAFTGDSKTDFSVQIQQSKDAGAELVFLPIYYQEATLILTQSKSANYSPIFFGCDGLDGILDVDGFDKTLAEGVMLLTPFTANATDETTQNFVGKYVAAYGETPNQFAADAYDAIYIIKAALEKSGITPKDGASAINDALKAAITEITYDGLTGEGMTWLATGEVSKAPKAIVIKNGEYQAAE